MTVVMRERWGCHIVDFDDESHVLGEVAHALKGQRDPRKVVFNMLGTTDVFGAIKMIMFWRKVSSEADTTPAEFVATSDDARAMIERFDHALWGRVYDTENAALAAIVIATSSSQTRATRTGSPIEGDAGVGRSCARPQRRGGPRMGGLTDEMVALGDVRRPVGGLRVGRGGGGQVAAQLVQVAADGVPAVALADHVA